MTIRPAGIVDIPALSLIHARSWKEAYRGMVPQEYLDSLSDDRWEPMLRAWLAAGNHALMLLEDGLPVGCCTYGAAREERFAGWGEIVSLYLLPGYIGRGYGQALLQAVLQDMEKIGYQKITLWVLRENRRARRFYRKNGFAQNGERCHSEAGGKQLTELRYVSG